MRSDMRQTAEEWGCESEEWQTFEELLINTAGLKRLLAAAVAPEVP